MDLYNIHIVSIHEMAWRRNSSLKPIPPIHAKITWICVIIGNGRMFLTGATKCAGQWAGPGCVSRKRTRHYLFQSLKIVNYAKTIQHKAMKKNMYTTDYILNHVCKYDVFEEYQVCKITNR